MEIRLRRFVRQMHRVLGLLVGLQLLLWVSGGAVMSVLRIEEVRGEHRAAAHALPALDPAAALVPIDAVVRAAERRPDTVTLTTLLDRPVYRLAAGRQVWLVDAASGARLSPLPATLAEQVARADYRGDGPLAALTLVETPASEYRERELPLWRAHFADDVNTTLYVSPGTGVVVARRNDLWRLFDFVWMLHIMDYESREDFNHPLLVGFAVTALLFVCSGLAMLVWSWWPRRAAAGL